MRESHTTPAKVFHWGFIILYAYGIFKQVDDISQLEDSDLLAFEVAFASIFLVIVMIRYNYMRKFKTFLGADKPVPKTHRYLAKSIHTSMYLCLILLPLSGLVIAGLFSQGITQGPMQDLALTLHEFSADLSYVLIAIHVGAALWSRIKGEGVWTSMVPIWKEEGATSSETIARLSRTENDLFNKIEKIFFSSKE
jgi:cytochrome b561